MATISPSVIGSNKGRHKPFIVLQWTPVTENDTAASIEVPAYTKLVGAGGANTDLLVHVLGTFGGATATVQQSIDGTNWVTAVDPGGTAITFTAAGANAIRDDYRHFRVTFSGGSSQSATVLLQINQARF